MYQIFAAPNVPKSQLREPDLKLEGVCFWNVANFFLEYDWDAINAHNKVIVGVWKFGRGFEAELFFGYYILIISFSHICGVVYTVYILRVTLKR